MGVRIVPGLFTRADYDRLPEGFPAQLVDGFLVKEPSPTYGHGRVAFHLALRLAALLGPERVLPAPADVAIDDHNVFRPDVVVMREVPSEHARDVGIPLLAIEVLSPSTAARDRRRKCQRLLAAGTAEVWLVDAAAGVVERHDADGVLRARGEETLRSRVVPGFEVVPARLFAPPER
jgi:Uma2 family endonuclease